MTTYHVRIEVGLDLASNSPATSLIGVTHLTPFWASVESSVGAAITTLHPSNRFVHSHNILKYGASSGLHQGE